MILKFNMFIWNTRALARPGNPGMYLEFCSDKFQAWKVLENDRKSWKTPGKIKQLDNTPPSCPFAENYLFCHVSSVRQAFPSLFLKNLKIQQLIYIYRTIKVCVSLCVYTLQA